MRCLPVLILKRERMSKRFKYLVSSIVSAVGFYLFLSLPYDFRYFGIMFGTVLIVFCFWFGLGVIFDRDLNNRIMTILLPLSFFLGFSLFSMILPISWWFSLILTLIFGTGIYLLFLVENVFWVAIGNRTPPLYRAAYTVSLIMLLVTSFLLFNSLYSFRLPFWANGLISAVIAAVLFLYQFWAVAIELPDDGEKKDRWGYVAIMAVILGELALALSFWSVGIFKWSIYLTFFVYVLATMISSEIKGRLFKSSWLFMLWVGIAGVIGMITMAGW